MNRLLRVLAAIGILALLGHGAALGVRTYLGKEYSDGSCKPCLDLNTCQPLELSLEVSKPWPRINRTHTLWHKVRLTNSSCLKIPSFNVLEIRTSGFEQTTYNRLNQRSLYFKVWNDRGQEISPYTVSRPILHPSLGQRHYDDALRVWEESGLARAIQTRGSRESEFGKVYPYRLADDSKTDISTGLEVNSQGFTALVPGSWAASAPSILAPYIEKVTLYDVVDPNRGGIGTGTRRELIPVAAPPGAQVPPPGFQILRGYVFDKPGKYRIAAIYQQEHFVDRIYPRFQALPGRVRQLIQLLERSGIRMCPQQRFRRQISVRSAEMAFEVLPR